MKSILREAVLFKHLLALLKKCLLFIAIGNSLCNGCHQFTIFTCLTQLVPHFSGHADKLIIYNATLFEFFVQEVLFIETYIH